MMIQIPPSWSHRTRWETLLDNAAAAAAEGRLPDALAKVKRLRAWQRRQNRGGLANHQWHDAELLWLEGVLLEHVGEPTRADAVWRRLARLFTNIAPRDFYFLPKCVYCAEREIGIAPNWFAVARSLREGADDIAATVAQFRRHALGESPAPLAETAVGEVLEPVADVAPSVLPTTQPHESPISAAALRAKRETIRLAYRELNQPAVVVHLSEEFLKVDPVDGVVWYWYGHRLAELARCEEAATALQTARGLVTRDDIRSLVLTAQGDLERNRGRLAEAEAYYREATECEGCGDLPWVALGRLHFVQGAFADAERCFRAAIAHPDRLPATALFELGLVLRARSSRFEARRVLTQALALSSHVEIYEALADVERVIRLQTRSGQKQKPSSP